MKLIAFIYSIIKSLFPHLFFVVVRAQTGIVLWCTVRLVALDLFVPFDF